MAAGRRQGVELVWSASSRLPRQRVERLQVGIMRIRIRAVLGAACDDQAGAHRRRHVRRLLDSVRL